MRGREYVKKFDKIINMVYKCISVLPQKFKLKIFNKIRNVKGKYGLLLRYLYFKSISLKCGENVFIGENVWLFSPDKIECGKNVSIHPMCYIDATGFIEIGDDVSIAHGVTILSTTHKFVDVNVNIKDQGIEEKKTIIENNVWIGAKATILSGIRVGRGSIIGANSVVTHNVPENSVVGGCSCKSYKKTLVGF